MARSSVRQRLVVSRAARFLIFLAAALWCVVLIRQFRVPQAQEHIHMGMEYAHNGDGGKAEQEWQTALRLDPNNAEALELLGGYYLSTNRPEAALAPYLRLLRLKPETPGLHGQLAFCFLRTGDEVSALRHAQEELKRAPNDITALTVSVRLLSGLGDERQRLEETRRLAKLRPDDVSSQTLLATALIEAGAAAESKPVLERILRLDPHNAQAYALRGEAEFNEDPVGPGATAAIADFTRSLQSDPTNAFARMYLGKIYRQRHRASEAIFQLEEAARLAPTKPEVYFELAGAYTEAGDARKAASARQRFLALRRQADLQSSLEKRCAVSPDDFQDRLDLGLITLRAGDYRKASFYLNAAHALRPGDNKTDAALRQLENLTGAK